MEHKEKCISRREIFKGKILSVYKDEVELANGNIASRELVDHNGGSCVLPITTEGKVVLVRQYRYGAGKELLEIPAGKLEIGEDPKAAAGRELKEETGYTYTTLEKLTEIYPTPGYSGEIIYIYYTKSITKGSQNLDEDEFVTVHEIPLEKAVYMCLSGEIQDGKTQIALLMYDNLLKRGEIE